MNFISRIKLKAELLKFRIKRVYWLWYGKLPKVKERRKRHRENAKEIFGEETIQMWAGEMSKNISAKLKVLND